MADLAATLPAGFTLGVGTAAWQVEGALATRGRTIWDDFADTPGAIVDGTTAEPACEHVARIDADVDLMAWLGASPRSSRCTTGTSPASCRPTAAG